MLRIGLTGGIGSGKSAVSDRFAELGVPVTDADVIAHSLTAPGGGAIEAIANAFGDGVIDADGAMDRDAMRALVFDDPSRREQLESILHPLIRQTMADQIAGFDFAYCILAIPLLVEGGTHPLVDRIVVVDAPIERRIQWIMARSALDEARIRSIMQAQATAQERQAVADDVIDNSGTLEDLRDRVDALHARFLALAKDYAS